MDKLNKYTNTKEISKHKHKHKHKHKQLEQLDKPEWDLQFSYVAMFEARISDFRAT